MVPRTLVSWLTGRTFNSKYFLCIQTLFPGQPNVPVDQAAFLIIELCWLSFINLMLRQQPCHWRPAYRRQNVEHQFHPNIVLVISVLWSNCGSNHWISCRWWWIANCQLAIYHSFLFHPDLQSDSVPAMASIDSISTVGLFIVRLWVSVLQPRTKTRYAFSFHVVEWVHDFFNSSISSWRWWRSSSKCDVRAVSRFCNGFSHSNGFAANPDGAQITRSQYVTFHIMR